MIHPAKPRANRNEHWSSEFHGNAFKYMEKVVFQTHPLRHLHSANPKTGPSRGLFLYVPKGFAGTIRPSETGRLRDIGLRTPTVSFHPPCALGETGSKHPCISRNWRHRVAPLFRWFRLVSTRMATQHGRRGVWYVLGVLREVFGVAAHRGRHKGTGPAPRNFLKAYSVPSGLPVRTVLMIAT